MKIAPSTVPTAMRTSETTVWRMSLEYAPISSAVSTAFVPAARAVVGHGRPGAPGGGDPRRGVDGGHGCHGVRRRWLDILDGARSVDDGSPGVDDESRDDDLLHEHDVVHHHHGPCQVPVEGFDDYDDLVHQFDVDELDVVLHVNHQLVVDHFNDRAGAHVAARGDCRRRSPPCATCSMGSTTS